MNFGKMDRKITLRSLSVAQNARGEDIESYSDLAVVWAMKIERPGRESFSSGTEQALRETVFVIRYRNDLTAKMQVVSDGETFDISQPPREIGRGVGLELSCVRRQG